MRDIFWNGSCDDCCTANYYNGLLTNNISFEERDESFHYTDVLHNENSDFIQKLYIWLTRYGVYGLELTKMKHGYFDFDQVEDEINMNEYMLFDDWWNQFEELLNKLKMILNSRKK